MRLKQVALGHACTHARSIPFGGASAGVPPGIGLAQHIPCNPVHGSCICCVCMLHSLHIHFVAMHYCTCSMTNPKPALPGTRHAEQLQMPVSIVSTSCCWHFFLGGDDAQLKAVAKKACGGFCHKLSSINNNMTYSVC